MHFLNKHFQKLNFRLATVRVQFDSIWGNFPKKTRRERLRFVVRAVHAHILEGFNLMIRFISEFAISLDCVATFFWCILARLALFVRNHKRSCTGRSEFPICPLWPWALSVREPLKCLHLFSNATRRWWLSLVADYFQIQVITVSKLWPLRPSPW